MQKFNLFSALHPHLHNIAFVHYDNTNHNGETFYYLLQINHIKWIKTKSTPNKKTINQKLVWLA